MTEYLNKYISGKGPWINRDETTPPKWWVKDEDILLVIDMQKDFAWPTGGGGKWGNFYVQEGEHTIIPIKEQIKGWQGPVYATVDYHPKGHCSFANVEEAKKNKYYNPDANDNYRVGPSAKEAGVGEGEVAAESAEGKVAAEPAEGEGAPCSGPFPPHCIIGEEGAKLIPDIQTALNERDDEKVTKVFHKGFHKDKDSFGGVHYECSAFGKDIDRASENIKGNCADDVLKKKTGAFNLNGDANKFNTFGYNPIKTVSTEEPPPDAPIADAFAASENDENSLWHHIKMHTGAHKNANIYVVGLAGDYCVLDTCRNLSTLLKEKQNKVYFVLNHTRFACPKGDKFLNKPEIIIEAAKRLLHDGAGFEFVNLPILTTDTAAWIQPPPPQASAAEAWANKRKADMAAAEEKKVWRGGRRRRTRRKRRKKKKRSRKKHRK